MGRETGLEPATTGITILNEDGSEEEPLKKTTIQRKFIKHNFVENVENTEFIFLR